MLARFKFLEPPNFGLLLAPRNFAGRAVVATIACPNSRKLRRDMAIRNPPVDEFGVASRVKKMTGTRGTSSQTRMDSKRGFGNSNFVQLVSRNFWEALNKD